MESEFVHRQNIERFELLLASKTLSPAQMLVVSGLLATEVETFALLSSRDPPSSAPPPSD